jgi:hypothetical protein
MYMYMYMYMYMQMYMHLVSLNSSCFFLLHQPSTCIQCALSMHMVSR